MELARTPMRWWGSRTQGAGKRHPGELLRPGAEPWRRSVVSICPTSAPALLKKALGSGVITPETQHVNRRQ